MSASAVLSKKIEMKPQDHGIGGEKMDQRKLPQRKPHKTMNGIQLLTKAMTGFFKPKSENQRKNEEIASILKKG